MNDAQVWWNAIHGITWPKGARLELVGAGVRDALSGDTVFFCNFCHGRIEFPPWHFVMYGWQDSYVTEAIRLVRQKLEPHWHVLPQPFTAEEKTMIVTRGIHRRGALRCL